MKVDMSPKAITERLRLTEELRRLCLSLAKAKPIAEENAVAESAEPYDDR